MANELQIPDFFVSQHACRRDYRADVARLSEAALNARSALGIEASQTDEQRILLLLIDPQMDFTHPGGRLFVGGRSSEGALADSVRTAEFIYRNAARLTQVMATLDTHHLFQIFFPEFWLLAYGRPPSANTLIGLDGDRLVNLNPDGSVIGTVLPNPSITGHVCDYDYDWLVNQAKHYVRELERGGKYALYLWSHHCLQGSDGHRMSNIIEEAMTYHSFARQAPPRLVQKGEHPLTENYSVFRPEVLTRHDAIGRAGSVLSDNLAFCDDELLKEVCDYDTIIVAGQASSHCVKSSVADLVAYCGERSELGRGKCEQIYLLTDCMSPVVVPGVVDFTDDAAAALTEFAQAGLHLVDSTVPMDEWPDFPQ